MLQTYFWYYAGVSMSELWDIRASIERVTAAYRWWQLAGIIGLGLLSGLAGGVLLRYLLAISA